MHKINMDNRKTRRHEINVTANLLCNDSQHPAKVLDISSGGAKIMLASSTLEANSHIQIDLPFLNELEACVAWANGRSCGLKFIDDQNRLSEFLYNLAIYGVAS